MGVLTNCVTAAASFTLFYLLLNGSGVGRSYDDELDVVDWGKAPRLLGLTGREGSVWGPAPAAAMVG